MDNNINFDANTLDNQVIIGKLDQILQYHKDKLDNTALRIQLGELTTKLEVLDKKLKDTKSVLNTSQHFLELIAEYAKLAREGTVEDYKGHLIHIRNLAEDALLNVEILGK